MQSGLRPPWPGRRHFGGDPPWCSRRRVGAASTTTAVVLTPLRRAGNRGPMDGNARGPGEMALAAGWLCFRAELRRRWRAWLALALIVGAFAGVVEAAAAGARRTDAAYPGLLAWSDAPDVLLFSFAGQSGTFGHFSLRPPPGCPGRSNPPSSSITRWRRPPPRISSPRRPARYRGGSISRLKVGNLQLRRHARKRRIENYALFLKSPRSRSSYRTDVADPQIHRDSP